jgi:pre-mRNA-processing factor 6
MEWALLEKSRGSRPALEDLLRQAVRHCPGAEDLWLMAAKEKWLADDVPGARQVLKEAFAANPNSEKIWLAAVKLENESQQPLRAQAILRKAREKAGTPRVWLKSALLERELGQRQAERELLEEALRRFPAQEKLWMMRAQLEDAEGRPLEARRLYQEGLALCPHSVPLWLCASRLAERDSAAKARSLLDRARLKNPKTPLLWLEAVRVELRAGSAAMAQSVLARALQECPGAGALWAEAIALEPPQKQKGKVVAALQHCDNDPLARVFWQDGKAAKARGWFNRALTLNADLGDVWAQLYKFELQHGTEEAQQQVVARCVEADPRHGEKWTSVSKAVENSRLKTEEILKKVALIV